MAVKIRIKHLSHLYDFLAAVDARNTLKRDLVKRSLENYFKLHHTLHHIEETDAGLRGLCIQEISLK